MKKGKIISASLASLIALGTINGCELLKKEDDNDTKYEVSDEYRYTILDDKVVNYRYVLEDTAATLINEYPLRDGFSLKWYNESSTFTDLNSLLTSNEEVIRITPEWTLENPEILSLNTNVDNNTFTYGDDITLISEVSNIADGIEFKYEWTCEDALYTGNNYVVSNVHPNQSGTYELKVTAYSNTITSLTSSSTKTMNISIEKKLLNFDWTLPSDLVYNGEDKVISSYYDDTEVINNDDNDNIDNVDNNNDSMNSDRNNDSINDSNDNNNPNNNDDNNGGGK